MHRVDGCEGELYSGLKTHGANITNINFFWGRLIKMLNKCLALSLEVLETTHILRLIPRTSMVKSIKSVLSVHLLPLSHLNCFMHSNM